jgi:purine-nucleoside phosphorylase
MSTVLETIAARRHGLDVLGISLITNAIAPASAVSHDAVVGAAEQGSERLAVLIEGVLGAL